MSKLLKSLRMTRNIVPKFRHVTNYQQRLSPIPHHPSWPIGPLWYGELPGQIYRMSYELDAVFERAGRIPTCTCWSITK